MGIAAWLRQLGLERYEPVFRHHEIDWEVLPELTEGDLERLGLPLGPRKKLLKAIVGIRGRSADVAPADTRDTAAAATLADGERRQVTVLFADLSGYARLSSQLDAEDMHALLGRFFERVDSIVEEYAARPAPVLYASAMPRCTACRRWSVTGQLRAPVRKPPMRCCRPPAHSKR